MNSNHSRLNKIQSLINQAKSTNDQKLRIRILGQIVSQFLDPSLQQCLKVISKKGELRCAPLQKLRQKALKELGLCIKWVNRYLSTQQLSQATKENIMQRVNRFEKDIVSGKPLDYKMLVPLEQALHLLLNEDNANESLFRKQFGKIRHINHDKSLLLSEAFPNMDMLIKEQEYLAQEKQTADWYAANQLVVFWQRYDFRTNDGLIKTLNNGTDLANLQHETNELLQYAAGGECPLIFPPTDEYIFFAQLLLDSIESMQNSLVAEITTFIFDFDKENNALSIADHKPIKFFRDTNVSSLINYLNEKNWKVISINAACRDLSMSPTVLKRARRQVNERLPDHFPNFLEIPDHPAELNKKNIIVSGVYKKHKQKLTTDALKT